MLLIVAYVLGLANAALRGAGTQYKSDRMTT